MKPNYSIFSGNWILLLMSLFFLFCSAFLMQANAATKTWSGATNTDWNTGSNWGGTAPVAGDIANIPGSLTNYPVINNTVSITTVNINSAGTGATITVTTGGLFTVSGLLTVNANGTFSQDAGISMLAGITVTGAVSVSGGTITSTGTITLNSGGTLSQSGGLIHLATTTGTNPTASLLISTGGILTQSGGTLYIKDWAAGGGTFNQTGSSALFKIFHDWKPGAGSVFNSTAGTVEFSGASAAGNFAAGTRQFNHILVDAGIDPLFDFTAASTIPISGNFTNNNTTLNVSTNATFTFNGTGAQTITSAVTGSTNATFGHLIANNATTITLTSNINIAGDLTVSQGTFDQATYAASRTAAGGTLTVSAGASLRCAGIFPSNFTTVTLSSTSTVEYYGAAAQTIAAYNYGNLTITGARAANNLTYASGTIGVSNAFSPQATFSSGARITTGNTINFNGSIAQTIPGFPYNNLTSSSTGTRTLDNSVSIGVAGVFTPGTNTYTITGSTVDFNGSVSQTIPAFNYNNLTSSSTGARTLASSGTIGIFAAFTPGTNSYTNTGSTIDFNGTGSQSIPAINYNNLTSSSTGARTLASSGTIGVAGNFTSGTNTYTVTGSTVDFNGSGAQAIGGITFNNLSTSNSGTKSSSGNIIVNGTFTVNTPTIFSPGAAYTISGSGTLTGDGTVQITRVTATADFNTQYILSKNISNLNVDYTGAGNQTVNALNYGSLTISTNGTRTVTLDNSGTIGVSANFIPTATTTTYIISSTTIDFNGSGTQNIPAFTFNNLSTSNAGSKTSIGNIVVNGTFNIGAGTTFIPGATYLISGTGTLTGNGTAQVTIVTVTADMVSQYTITNKTLTNLTIEYSGAGAQTINNALGNYCTLRISGSGTKSLQGNIIITTDLIISAGTLDVTASNYSISIAGNWTNNVAAANFTPRAGTITFNGTGAQAINGTAASQTFYNIVVSKTVGQTLSTGGITTSVTVNDFTETTGNFTAPSTFAVNGNVLLSTGTFITGTTTVGGNWTNNGGSLSGTSIIFSGTSKTIGGSSATTFPDLSISSGTVTLNTNASCTSFNLTNNNVVNSFTISNGITLTVNGNAILNQASGNGVIHAFYVNGGIAAITGNLTYSITTNNAGREVQAYVTTGTLTIGGDLIINNTLLAANSVLDLSGGSATVYLAGNFNINTLGTFTAGTSSTFVFNGSGSQTIPALTYANLTSSNTGSRILASSGTISITGVFTKGTNSYTNTGSTISFNNTNAQTVPVFDYNNLTVTGARTSNFVTFASGIIRIAGTFSPSSTFTTGGRITTGNTIEFNGSSAQTIPAFPYNNLTSSSAGARTLASSGTVGVAGVFTEGTNSYTVTGSMVNYNGSGAQAVEPITYNNLTLSNGGIKTFSYGTANVGGILTVATGPTLSVSGGTLNVTGAFTPCVDINAGGTLSQSGGTLSFTGGTTNVNGIYNQSAGTYLAIFNMNINSGGVLNQSGTGLIHMATNIGTTPTDNIVINTGGTVNQTAGTIELKDIQILTDNTAVYNQSGSGSVLSIERNYGNTGGTFNSTGGLVWWKSTTAGDGGVHFDQGASQFFNVLFDGSLDPKIGSHASDVASVAGNWTNNNSAMNMGGSTTITFNGTGVQNIGGSVMTTFKYVVINKASSYAILTTNEEVNGGNLTITSGILDLSTYAFNRTSSGGTLSIAAGATMRLANNTGGQTGSNYPLNFNTNTLNATSTVEYYGLNSITQTVYGTTYGHLLLTNGTGSGTAPKITTANITVNGNLTVSTGVLFTPTAANLVAGTGTLTGSGTAQVTRVAATPDMLNQYTISNRVLTNLTIDYFATQAQTVNALNYSNLIISGARTTNSVTLANSGSIGISGVFTPSASFTSGDYIRTSSTVDFNGASAQNIPAFTFNGLTISGGSVKTATGNINVNAALTLTSGLFTTSTSNLLTLIAGSSTSGASNTSFVNGPMKKIGNSGFVFPVGKSGTGYQAVEISAPSNATDAFTAEYMRTSALTIGTAHTAPLTSVSSCEYWQLDRTTGTSTVDVTLYGNTNSGCGANTGANYFTGGSTPTSSLRVAHWSGSAWENATTGSTTITGTSPNLTVKAAAVSNFSPFSFGSVGSNPLPVKLISFTAEPVDQNVILKWNTATEKNNDHFNIERSVDGKTFIKIGEVKGNGSTLNISEYNFLDNSLDENVKIYFYRLKQVDYYEEFEYSSIVKVNLVKQSGVTISNISPNPFTSNVSIIFYQANNEKVKIKIIDATGRVLATQESAGVKGMNAMDFNTSGFAQGLYFISASCNGVTTNLKMVVKE